MRMLKMTEQFHYPDCISGPGAGKGVGYDQGRKAGRPDRDGGQSAGRLGLLLKAEAIRLVMQGGNLVEGE